MTLHVPSTPWATAVFISSHRVSPPGEWEEIGHLGIMYSCPQSLTQKSVKGAGFFLHECSSLTHCFPSGQIRLLCKQGDFWKEKSSHKLYLNADRLCRMRKNSHIDLFLKKAWGMGCRVVTLLCLWIITLTVHPLSKPFYPPWQLLWVFP